LKLENIMVHFPNLPNAKNEQEKYKSDLDIEKNSDQIICKIGDLGVARKIENNQLCMT